MIIGISCQYKRRFPKKTHERGEIGTIIAIGSLLVLLAGTIAGPKLVEVGTRFIPRAAVPAPTGGAWRIATPQGSTTCTYASQFGSAGTGDGQFHAPWGVAVTADKIYVADSLNHRIQVFSRTGQFISQWGNQGSGNGQFETPTNIRIGSDGKIYVVDTNNNRIQVFDASGGFLQSITSFDQGKNFIIPRDLAFDGSGNIYVGDNAYRIVVFDNQWNYKKSWSGFNTVLKDMDLRGVTVYKDGNIYVTEGHDNQIVVFDTNGTILLRWGSLGSDPGKFNGPQTIFPDQNGNFFVTDYYNSRVQIVNAMGGSLSSFGSQGIGNGQLSYPRSAFVDTDGKVYVADTGNNRIEVFACTQTIVTGTISPIPPPPTVTPTPTPTSASGLIGYWPMDEGDGTIVHNNGSGGAVLDGTAQDFANPPTATSGWTIGKIGASLLFSGATDRVNIANTEQLRLATFSFTAWIKSAGSCGTVNTFCPIFDNQSDLASINGFYIGLNHLNLEKIVEVIKPGNGISSETIIQPNVWYHLAVVYGDEHLRLYINGRLDTDMNSPQPFQYSSLFSDSNIGWYRTGTFGFNGNIDDVRIYNRVLSNDEIYDVAGTPPTPTSTLTPTATPSPTPTMVPCPRGASGNLDCSSDGCIRTTDSELFRQNYGKLISEFTTPSGQHTPDLVVDSENRVGTADYEILRQNFGSCSQ